MATAQRGEINAGSLTLRADVIHNHAARAPCLRCSCECACWEGVYVEAVKRAAEETQEEPVGSGIQDLCKRGTLCNTDACEVQGVRRSSSEYASTGGKAK